LITKIDFLAIREQESLTETLEIISRRVCQITIINTDITILYNTDITLYNTYITILYNTNITIFNIINF